MILCIETTTLNCSVALSKEGSLVASVRKAADQYVHAEALHELIEQCMQLAGTNSDALKAVAVSAGPGSYTGLRIGLAAAKGFCYSLGLPLIAIDTLTMLGQYGLAQGDYQLAIPMLDARRLEVYSSRVSIDQVGEAEAIVLDQAFFDELPKLPIIILGDGASKCRQFQAVHAHIAEIPPDASMMIDLAQSKYAHQHFENVAYFEPCYLKEYIVGVSTKSVF